MAPETLAVITGGAAPKGDVLATARLAGIMAAKRTHELIPLCHPLALSFVGIDITPAGELPGLRIVGEARLTGKTGVEMEALTAASVAALTVYDMVQGDRPRHGDRERAPAREERRPQRPVAARGAGEQPEARSDERRRWPRRSSRVNVADKKGVRKTPQAEIELVAEHGVRATARRPVASPGQPAGARERREDARPGARRRPGRLRRERDHPGHHRATSCRSALVCAPARRCSR